MDSRMDKYKDEIKIPTRSDKNKNLYKQVYNAYDEFENLVVPSNSKVIDITELKKEISISNANLKKHDDSSLNLDRREKKLEQDNDDVYDINELLNKAVDSNSKPELVEHDVLVNSDYLKKLKLDNTKTNIEQVKEMYESMQEEAYEEEEDESLMRTANLSLEILSDLKGDNDKTIVEPPIKADQLPDDMEDDFYTSEDNFKKRDFDHEKDLSSDEEDEDEEDDDFFEKTDNGKFFFKILMIIFGISLIVLVLLYFINYFNKV